MLGQRHKSAPIRQKCQFIHSGKLYGGKLLFCHLRQVAQQFAIVIAHYPRFAINKAQSAEFAAIRDCKRAAGIKTNLRIIGDEGLLDVDAYGELRIAQGGEWKTVASQAPIDWQGKGKRGKEGTNAFPNPSTKES